jgi:hypothetical protein
LNIPNNWFFCRYQPIWNNVIKILYKFFHHQL